MNDPIRLTVVMTHPVQYMAPWFRHLTEHCRQLELTVLYAVDPTPEQQGVGFERAFRWDGALTAGYRCRVLRPGRSGDDLASSSYHGVDVPEVVDALAASQPEVALVPGWHSITLRRALAACRRLGVPVLYRGDSNLASAPRGWRRALWEVRSRWLLGRYAGYLAVGRRSRRYLEHFGVPRARIFSSPHAVDNAAFAALAAPHQTADGQAAARRSFGLHESGLVVLFAGKLEAKKRPQDLIEAVASLGSEVSLLVVGSGELEAECRELAAQRGVQVAWAGFLNQSELGRAYAAADYLALPSDGRETWGLVVNEALASGLPVVVSDAVGCTPDLVTPGETGEVHPVGDPNGLNEALARLGERLATGQAAREELAAACRRRAAEYSFAQAATGLVAACQAVVRRRARAGRPAPPRVVAPCGGFVVVSGNERMVFEILRLLRCRGTPVHTIVNSWENHRIVPLAEGIGSSWSVGRYRAKLDRRARHPAALAGMVFDIAATSWGLVRDAWHHRATHVLMPEFLSVLRNAPALAWFRLAGVKVVLQLGNAPAPGGFYRRVWRYGVAPLVDRIVANSDFTRRELLAHGVAETKIERIYNCVPWREATEPKPAERQPGKLFFAGQIIPEKGLDLLLEGVALVVAKGYDVHLDVAGQMDRWEAPSDRGYRDRLLSRASRPDLANKVRFLGWRDDVPELLAAADLHCCPSLPEIREGFGLVVLEAKRVGCPSVVFASGALSEVVTHGVDGWVCQAATVAALAEGIEIFMADGEFRSRAGRAARASFENFSRASFANRWWRVFQPIEEERRQLVGDGTDEPA